MKGKKVLGVGLGSVCSVDSVAISLHGFPGYLALAVRSRLQFAQVRCIGKCQWLEESKSCSCPQLGQVPWIDSVTSLVRVRFTKTNTPAKANPGTRRKWATGMKMLISAAPQATASPFTARPMRSARSKVVTVATPAVELSS